MAIPPRDCGCDPCCTGLYDIAVEIKALALQAVLDCAGDSGCCDNMVGYVAHGPQHYNPSGDYVAVWVEEYGFATRGNSAQNLMTRRARFAVKLMETGWPSIQGVGTQITVPSPEEIDWASRHLLGHAEAMMGAVLVAAKTKVFGCGFVAIDGMRPLQPTATLAGYQFSIVVDA